MGRKTKHRKKGAPHPGGATQKNKNGIDVFYGETDFYQLFSGGNSNREQLPYDQESEGQESPEISDHKRTKEPSVRLSRKDLKRTSSTASGSPWTLDAVEGSNRKGRSKKQKVRKVKEFDVTKWEAMIASDASIAPEEAASIEKSSVKRAGDNAKYMSRSDNGSDDVNDELSRLKKDKHGIPFLDGVGSLFRFFRDRKEPEKKENFPKLLETSLKGKGEATLLREKSDKTLPTPIPLKKRLKRYPPPQQELDLHGFTSTEARSRTESWLRRLWRNGFFTVRIVVGRGLHSEFGAVLPDVVEELLTQLKRDGVVLWFEWDGKHKSKSGALVAYLKQFD